MYSFARHITFLVVCLIAFSANVVVGYEDENEGDDAWSKCSCPASDPNYDASNKQDQKPFARMAYLISMHNRRTISDAAYLIKALMESSHPGNTAIILIHVDHRVGIASRDDNTENNADETNQYLYHDSNLKKYVDTCLAAPACARSGNGLRGSNNNNATILEVHSHFAPEWSKWSMNDPTLWGMDYLTHHPLLNNNRQQQTWDAFVNLSGDTLPVITAQRISQLFEPKNGPLGSTNFVTSASCVTGLIPTSIFDFPKHTMKRSHYFSHNIPKKLSYVDQITGEWKKDAETTVYFGSQWMALTHEFVEYVIRSMDHPNGLGNVLMQTLVDTEVLMTDETFFATMLMNSPAFKDTIPNVNQNGALQSYPSMYSLRYERMDENIPNAWGKYTSSNPLYDIPTRFGKATGGEGPAKAWGPYFLGVYDFGAIRQSGALFVRKVSWTVDPNMVLMLPVEMNEKSKGKSEWDMLPDLMWPKLGVNIKDPFVWKAEEEEEE